RTERTLVNMADGYSRVSNARRVGVAAVQHGPGAENAYAGVAQAYADGSPLLFLPGGNPATRADLPPNFDAPHSYRLSITHRFPPPDLGGALLPSDLRGRVRPWSMSRQGAPTWTSGLRGSWTGATSPTSG